MRFLALASIFLTLSAQALEPIDFSRNQVQVDTLGSYQRGYEQAQRLQRMQRGEYVPPLPAPQAAQPERDRPIVCETRRVLNHLETVCN